MQGCVDLAAVLIGFAIGYGAYVFDGTRQIPYDLYQYMGLGLLTGLIMVAVFHAFQLYERKVSLLHVVESRRLFVGWALASLILFFLSFYFRFLDLSRLMMSISLAVSLLLLIVGRSFLYHAQMMARIRGGAAHAVVIYGAGVVGRHLYKRIYHSPGLGMRVLGFLDDDEKLWEKEVHVGEIRRQNDNSVLGDLRQIEALKKEGGLAEVFVALPNASYKRNLEIVDFCRKANLAVSVVPPTYGHYIHNIEVEDIGGIPVIRQKEDRARIIYPALKRVFDLAVSLIMIFFLSPIFALLALVVRCDSPGPVIFRQRRVGKDGKEFDFYKFRTMYVDANPYAQTPNSSADSRITPFGRWLRRSSLDELPQLWSVVQGEMSLVGPRPEMPFIVNEYNAEQRQRLSVKPGITGVWQISAVRGEPIHANMEYDLFYIEHRSLLLDLIIMIKTLATAIRGIGAF